MTRYFLKVCLALLLAQPAAVLAAALEYTVTGLQERLEQNALAWLGPDRFTEFMHEREDILFFFVCLPFLMEVNNNLFIYFFHFNFFINKKKNIIPIIDISFFLFFCFFCFFLFYFMFIIAPRF